MLARRAFFLRYFSSTERDQKKGKKDEDLQENPNDFRDPSVEHKERLLALEEEIADEEDKEIAKEEDTSSQDPPHVQCLRNLVCLDEKGEVLFYFSSTLMCK